MFKIYSQKNCSYCERAKALLRSKNLPFEEVAIGTDITKDEFLRVVPNARTVPQIFHSEKHIGGYTELAKYLAGSA